MSGARPDANSPPLALRGSLRGSLRLRLLVGTLAWILLSIALTGWALSGLFRQHVAQQFHAELSTHLDQLAAQLSVDSQGKISLAAGLSDPRFSKPYSGHYWQIDRLGQSGSEVESVMRSRSLWDGVLKLPIDVPHDGEIHHHRIVGPDQARLSVVERVVLPEETLQSLRLVVAVDTGEMVLPVKRFSGLLWLALGLLGVGLGLVVVFQVLIGLAPLKRLHGALAGVRSGATTRLDGRFPREIQPLVEEFNTVLGQNAEIVERARTQAGNLAHALKTPLSVIANAVGSQMGSQTGAQTSELAQLVAAQVSVAQKQIDYHLRRSRAAAAVRVPGARTPVRPVIDGLWRVMARIHAERNLEFVVRSGENSAGSAQVFRGEEQDLQEMLGNLLDNACKWAQQRIEIELMSVGDEISITLDDDGCGIAAAERERVLNRGERADEQMPGSGLGLAIVEDLVRLYGGRIELGNSPLGGLRCVLILPGA